MWRRVVIEKPFGHDLRSAQELNEIVNDVFPEDAVFRIDHYLGKETVQNLLALRFANELFEPIWNAHYVDHVQITMAEDIGVGGRAGYYDGIGAARDVIQNHLLQLLALTAMEEPVSFSPDDLREEKIKVLSAVKLPSRWTRPPRAASTPAAGRAATRSRACLEEEGFPPTRTPRPTPRSPPRWTPAAGPGCRSTCAPASASGGGSPRSRSSSSARRTCRSTHDRHRGARPERAGDPRAAGRGRHAAVRVEGARLGHGGPRRHDGLRLRHGVHRGLPEAYERLLLDVLLGEPSLFPTNDRGRAVLADPRPGDREVAPRGHAGQLQRRHLGPAVGRRAAPRTGRQWRSGDADEEQP